MAKLALGNVFGQRHGVDQGPETEDDVVAGSRALAAAVAFGSSEDPDAEVKQEEAGDSDAEEDAQSGQRAADVFDGPAMLDGRGKDVAVQSQKGNGRNGQHS